MTEDTTNTNEDVHENEEVTETESVPEPADQYEYMSPVNKELQKVTGIPLLLPKDIVDEKALDRAIKNLDKDEKISDEEKAHKLRIMRDLIKSTWSDGRYNGILTSMVSQYAFDGDNKIRITHGKVTTNGSGNITGNSAVQLIASLMNTTTGPTIPCWHSGIKIRLGVFTKTELLQLQVLIQERKNEVTTDTRGLIFSTDDVHTNTTVMDFILDRVIACSLKEWNIDTLRHVIRVQDIPVILAGALSGMYPKGYPFMHACVKRDTCDYVSTANEDGTITHIDFRKVVMLDTSKLTKRQTSIINKPLGDVNMEEVEEYQRAVDDLLDSSYKISEANNTTISMHVSSPTYYHYRKEGMSWLTEIGAQVSELLAKTDDLSVTDHERKRRTYIRGFINTLRIQKNACWVNKITVTTRWDDEDSVMTIDDLPTIVKTLEEMGKDDDIRNDVIDKMEDYKVKSFIAFTGVANFKCPKCGSSQKPDDFPYAAAIPINIASYFFDLMEWSLAIDMQ